MPHASIGSPLIAWSMSSALRKSGVLGSTGVSRPLNVTCFALAPTPALSRTRASGTPTQRALPIAPFASCAPKTRGDEKPRLLPEHWLTATSSTVGNMSLTSASDSDSGFETTPLTVSRYVARSTDSGMFARW